MSLEDYMFEDLDEEPSAGWASCLNIQVHISIRELQVYLSQFFHLFKISSIDGSPSMRQEVVIYMVCLLIIKLNSKEIDGVPVTGTAVGSRTVYEQHL